MTTRQDLANAIRALSMDAVEQANSGHPGMPMGMADMAEVLWNDFLRHNPADPNWPNRDRFVLSNGHGSMLLYSLLHLSGYDLSIEDLKSFRQLHAKTAGHPELGYAPGIETTTGPLGQGLANAVGMALAEKTLAAQFNRKAHAIIDHHTYVFLGDGCLMEGISHEVSSLAGVWKLGKLIALWDDNGISIDGEVAPWFGDNTPARFEAYGWHVVRDVDGHDPEQVKAAIQAAKDTSDRPSLICCKTQIGFGAPNKAGTSSAHGSPLGAEEIKAARKSLGWNHPPFEIPQDIYAAWQALEKGKSMQAAWDERFAQYQQAHPELAAEFLRRISGELPSTWQADAEAAISSVNKAQLTIATRKASQVALDYFGGYLPELLGGSADLTGSNLTKHKHSVPINQDEAGNYIYYGVREFGMSAIMNGLALHGGFIPYGGTFLVFSDYARNALRMAALMKQRVIFVYTHDSIGLGEDGPTHQPVEHLATLRAIPNMSLWRPADAVESVVAWRQAILRTDGPTSLVFSRQSLPHQARDAAQIEAIQQGGYVLVKVANPQLVLIATGSEVALAVDAQQALAAEGVEAQVVSMPATDVFLNQSEAYQASVLPPELPKLAIEAGVTGYWRRFVGTSGAVIGLDQFGESAPAKELFEQFGFTVNNIVKVAKTLC